MGCEVDEGRGGSAVQSSRGVRRENLRGVKIAWVWEPWQQPSRSAAFNRAQRLSAHRIHHTRKARRRNNTHQNAVGKAIIAYPKVTQAVEPTK